MIQERDDILTDEEFEKNYNKVDGICNIYYNPEDGTKVYRYWHTNKIDILFMNLDIHENKLKKKITSFVYELKNSEGVVCYDFNDANKIYLKEKALLK